jgi:hypothetical protein
MPLILGANSLTGGYEVDNSLRFNSGSSDNLTRTPASATNRKTFTVSFWYKRSILSTRQQIFSQYEALNNNEWVELRFDDDNKLTFSWYSAGVFTTNQLFRDVGAWYHIVLAVDTTQATDANRIKLYVNGSQVTSFSSITYPAQNYDTGYNQASSYHIGDLSLNGNFDLDGYLAEYYSIDGQALDPTDFGEFDSATGIWKPIAYEGTYGTNGFYLEFKDSSALGDDTSGNGNDFTVNNLTSIDQTTDTPTNNFSTFNSIKFSGGTLTQGNLELDSASGSWKTRNSTIGVSAGKWFMEFKMGSISADESGVAIMPDTVPDGNFPASDATRSPGIAYNSDGRKLVNGSATSAYFSAMSSSDIIGIALDMDGGTVQFYRNGSTTGSPIDLSDAFTSSNYPLFFVAAVYGTRDVQANFGNPPFTISSGNSDANGYGNFEYSVPSGYYALNTKNLAKYG